MLFMMPPGRRAEPAWVKLHRSEEVLQTCERMTGTGQDRPPEQRCHARNRSARRQRCVKTRFLADDAASVADRKVSVAFGKNRRQRPRIWRGKPQAQQVAPALHFGPVFVRRASV